MCPDCIVCTRRYCERCGRLIKRQKPGADRDLLEFQASVERQNNRIASRLKCRVCGTRLVDGTRYFNCGNCLPYLSAEDGMVYPPLPGKGLWVNDVA